MEGDKEWTRNEKADRMKGKQREVKSAARSGKMGKGGREKTAR